MCQSAVLDDVLRAEAPLVELILIILLIVLLLGGGWTSRPGWGGPAEVSGVLWIIFVIVLIVLLVRFLGVL